MAELRTEWLCLAYPQEQGAEVAVERNLEMSQEGFAPAHRERQVQMGQDVMGLWPLVKATGAKSTRKHWEKLYLPRARLPTAL